MLLVLECHGGHSAQRMPPSIVRSFRGFHESCGTEASRLADPEGYPDLAFAVLQSLVSPALATIGRELEIGDRDRQVADLLERSGGS